MAILNVVGLFFLVPKFSIIGAAWAYLISVLPVVVMVWWIEKYLSINNTLKFYLALYSRILFVSLIRPIGLSFERDLRRPFRSPADTWRRIPVVLMLTPGNGRA